MTSRGASAGALSSKVMDGAVFLTKLQQNGSPTKENTIDLNATAVYSTGRGGDMEATGERGREMRKGSSKRWSEYGRLMWREKERLRNKEIKREWGGDGQMERKRKR